MLMGSVGQGLMKNRQNDLFDRMTKKRAINRKQKKITRFFPIATLLGIFQQITLQKSLYLFWPNQTIGFPLSSVLSAFSLFIRFLSKEKHFGQKKKKVSF